MENLNYEVLSFLTTSSAGLIPDHLMLPLTTDARLRRAGKKRVVAFIAETPEIRNLEKFRVRLTEPVMAVERTQIGRRARAVAGVNNPWILASLPFLRAAESLQKILRHASSGKQRGHIGDLGRMLHWSSLPGVLLSSMDVSGFDASVQMVSQTQFISLISEALGPIARGRYLCYDPTHVTLPDGTDMVVPAFQVLASDVMARFQPQSTMVKGKVLEYVYTADPTFPSGLAFTTVHHTIRLISSIYGDICLEIDDGKISSLQETGVQGDDIRLEGPKCWMR